MHFRSIHVPKARLEMIRHQRMNISRINPENVTSQPLSGALVEGINIPHARHVAKGGRLSSSSKAMKDIEKLLGHMKMTRNARGKGIHMI